MHRALHVLDASAYYNREWKIVKAAKDIVALAYRALQKQISVKWYKTEWNNKNMLTMREHSEKNNPSSGHEDAELSFSS